MISSFTSYQKLMRRGGVGVGGQTIQDIIDFHMSHRLEADTGDHDGCSLRLFVDCDRDDPFFAMLLSTKKLLAEMDLSRPLETDETFKVIHEGYPLTLIGQSDMNRKFHLR
jgi:hypothetical protein